MIPLSTYLRQYKVGDIVDVVVNGAVQKGSVFLSQQQILQHTHIAQYALQGLPRQDWHHLQRHKIIRRRDPTQASRQPIHGEAHQRTSRARSQVEVARRVPQQSQGECSQARDGKDGQCARAPQETACNAQRGAHRQRKGQAREHCADCIRHFYLGC